jgi:hypothetical protein
MTTTSGLTSGPAAPARTLGRPRARAQLIQVTALSISELAPFPRTKGVPGIPGCDEGGPEAVREGQHRNEDAHRCRRCRDRDHTS